MIYSKMNILPPELIYYISEYLCFNDRYSFSKTNYEIYKLIWRPMDMDRFINLLFYSSEINFYGTLFSDNPEDWINHPFTFYLSRFKTPNKLTYDEFTFGYYYSNPNLHMKIYKINNIHDDITPEQIDMILQIRKYGFQTSYIGNVCTEDRTILQIEFVKPIGSISQGYDILLDKIHENILSVVMFYNAESYIPVYFDDSVILSDNRNIWLDIFIENISKLSLDKNKEYYKEEICSTYYFNVWYETQYQYQDYDSLRKVNEVKQKYLSREIHGMLKSHRLTSESNLVKDLDTLKRLASYIQKKIQNNFR